MVPALREAFERELQGVKDDVLQIGSLVDTAIERALTALIDRNVALAQVVAEGDQEINSLRYRLEEKCVWLIAHQQPAARDLRMIVAAMNIDTELERVADHAAGIARIVVQMGEEPLIKPLIDMPLMAEAARDMVARSLEAFAQGNAGLAREVARRDDFVDQLYQQVFRELLTYMMEDPRTITRALYLLFIAHNLERIGDRATNIAERVIFMTSGELRELNPEPDAAQLH
jgi:phosphate transport system protein